MLAKKVALFIFIISVVLLIGCKADVEEVVQYGTISVSASGIEKTTRTIEPAIDEITCSYYKVYGTHSTFDANNPNPDLHFERRFEASSCSVVIMTGIWNVYVEGYNDQNLLIARSANQNVVITKENITNATFALSYITEGIGTVNLLVRIPDTTPVAKVSFKIGDTDTVITSIPDSVEGYYNVSLGNDYTLPVGDYNVQLKLFDSSDRILGIPLNDRIHVYANLTSGKTWTDPGKVVAPVISTSGSTPSDTTVSISTETEGASIYYTTDGSAPSARSTKYTGPFSATASMTVKAIAVHPSLFNSNVASLGIVFMASIPSVDVVAGTYSNTQTVALSCATAGASIRYTTDGSVPTLESTLYSAPVAVDHNLTLKAVAFAPGYEDSPVMAIQYEIKVADPIFSFDSGLLESETVLRLSSATNGVSIYYTLDGSTPSSSSNAYTDSGIVINRTTEVKAIAVKNGCSDSEVTSASYTLYTVGGLGPAGGYVFYDCDADNNSGNTDGLISSECGWRFLEAAPADLRSVDGILTVDSSLSGYSSAYHGADFGYYRTEDNGSNLYINGTDTYDSSNCTVTEIGTGKANTRLLVDTMGNDIYYNSSGASKTAKYAAKICDIFECTVGEVTFDDWFLPSKDELNLMFLNLHEAGLGGFTDIQGNSLYWSSSECPVAYEDARYAWTQAFYDGSQSGQGRGSGCRVRPIRAFSLDCPNGHDVVVQPAVEPTCGGTGLTSGLYCSRCGHVFEEQEIIPATGLHDYESHVCIECGEHEYYSVSPEGVLTVKNGISLSGAIVVPDTIKGIAITALGDAAFSSQINMTEITLPDSVTSIGREAFMGCQSLSGITIPDGVTVIADNTFWDCRSLHVSNIIIPDSVETIGNYSFACTFRYNPGEEFVIPDSITTLGCGVFVSSDIGKVVVPRTVTHMYAAFDSYQGSIVFEEGTTEIPANAHLGAQASSVTVPSSVTTLNDNAFASCTITNIIILCTTPPELGENVFGGATIGSVTVPYSYDHSILNAYENAGWGGSISFVETTPKVGDTGPAGGIIIYDCDADNDTGNADGLVSSECKWRFIERSASTIATSIPFCYKEHSPGSYTSASCNANLTAVGTGRSNTENLVEAMGKEGWLLENNFYSNYAAKVAYNYVSTYQSRLFSDWYLPSIDELKLKPVANVCWSSSEYNADRAYQAGGSKTEEKRYYRDIVAVRYFSMDEPFGHSYECEIVDEATCTTSGTRRFVCSVCGDEYSETYWSTHDVDWTPGHIASCSICGKIVRGPAGGDIFYDVDEDNDATNNGAGPDGLKSSECGWKYLEATPYELSYRGIESGYSTDYCFGQYSKNSGTTWLFSNGTTTYNSANCTKTGIGDGKANTELLVAAMGTSYGYYLYEGREDDEYRVTSAYAAKKASDLEYNGYSDWFVPSRDELNAWYQYIKENNMSFKRGAYYLSSSENTSDARRCWGASAYPNSLNDFTDLIYRYDDYNKYVRPVRQVLNSEL